MIRCGVLDTWASLWESVILWLWFLLVTHCSNNAGNNTINKLQEDDKKRVKSTVRQRQNRWLRLKPVPNPERPSNRHRCFCRSQTCPKQIHLSLIRGQDHQTGQQAVEVDRPEITVNRAVAAIKPQPCPHRKDKSVISQPHLHLYGVLQWRCAYRWNEKESVQFHWRGGVYDVLPYHQWL